MTNNNKTYQNKAQDGRSAVLFEKMINGTDLSFDGLRMADRGVKLEHLAPTGQNCITYSFTVAAMQERINVIDNALSKLTGKKSPEQTGQTNKEECHQHADDTTTLHKSAISVN